jgi:predicted GNAT family acetyltransferase
MSEVRNNADLNRFELDVDGGMAVAYYRATPGRITITHTEVPTRLRGHGVGSTLVRGALELARAQGLKVTSRCPFVSAYLGKHPEFNDLLG